MTPYYDDAGVTIYHGDCLDVLPTLCQVDLVITDPPYGISQPQGGGRGTHGWTDFRGDSWDAERPEDATIRMCIEKGRHVVLWGGNYFLGALPGGHRNKWLIWDKGQTDFSLADCEMAWCSWDGAVRRLVYPRALALKDGKQHPTQKPAEVMTWSITQAPEGDILLDPFMGSGTTLVAAKRLGRRAIGIEIEEKYCEIAAKRLAQGALPLEFSS